MESKRQSIQLQCSFIEHEQTRLLEAITGCLNIVSASAKTAASRSELQQLSQLNSELSGRVTAVADDIELLQHKLELLSQQQESAAYDQLSSRAESVSLQLSSGQRDSSVGSSPRHSLSQGRRADRNVALRHLQRPPEREASATGRSAESGSRPDSDGASSDSPPPPASPRPPDSPPPPPDSPPPDFPSPPASPAPSSPPPSATALASSTPAAASADVSSLPSRDVSLRVMHEVTLAHHDVLEDSDVLFLNLREDEPSLETLSHDLEALSEDPQYTLSAAPRPGRLVFAQWDGTWYRGRVVSVAAGQDVEVQFVDYGNYDTVPLSACRLLPERLARMPVCAVECTLMAAVAAPAGWQRQLQQLMLDALLAPGAPVRALFRRPDGAAGGGGAGPLQAQLAVTVTVGTEPRVLDVARTLNNVMSVSLEDAREQVETQNLALERLMEPFVPTRRDGGAGQSRVLDWLTAGGQDGTEAEPPPSPPPPLQPVPRVTSNGRMTARADPAGGEPAGPLPLHPPQAASSPVPQPLVDPPKYRQLGVCWHSRPIYRAPRELCARKTHRDVIIVKAQSPEDFYISFDSQDAFENFQRRLQEVYSRLPVHPRQGLHSDLLCAGSFWAARCSDGDWCRVVILQELPHQGGDGLSSYRVRAVDFGDDLVVPADQLRPMLEQFASQPVFIVRATCSGVAPLSEEGYSEAARERFIALVDVAGISAHTVSSETTSERLAVVLYHLEHVDLLPITQTMAAEGLVEHWFVQEDVLATAPKPAAYTDPELQLCDPSVPPPNMRVPEPPPLPSSDDWLPEEEGGERRLPPAGEIVYVKVTAVVSPKLFYCVLPFGTRPAQLVNADFAAEVQRLESDDSVETLAAAMRRFYGSRSGLGGRAPPPAGSPVAVRWQGGWHRGTVLTADEDHAEVFLVDWGHSEPVPREDLREMVRRFQQLPPQAVPCALGSAATGALRHWPPAAVERLVRLAQRGLLLARVLAEPTSSAATSVTDPRLLVDLYHATGLDDGVWASQMILCQ